MHVCDGCLLLKRSGSFALPVFVALALLFAVPAPAQAEASVKVSRLEVTYSSNVRKPDHIRFEAKGTWVGSGGTVSANLKIRAAYKDAGGAVIVTLPDQTVSSSRAEGKDTHGTLRGESWFSGYSWVRNRTRIPRNAVTVEYRYLLDVSVLANNNQKALKEEMQSRSTTVNLKDLRKP